MNKTTAIVLGIGSIIFIVCLFAVFGIVGWSNNEVQLRQQVVAQQKVNETVFDNTWKTISQTAQVTDKYKESFRVVYKDMMEGRYSADKNQNPLFKWINESNPQFGDAVFTRLVTIIEANRATFTLEQKKLIDLNRQHITMISTFPGSLFASFLGRIAIQITVVTSETTEKVFKNGREDSIKVF